MVESGGARLLVDLDAVASNWQGLRQEAAAATCAAVVKADAYGLGAAAVARRLAQAGCRTFFVAQLDEALQLQSHLPATATLLVLNGLLPGTARACADAGVLPVLNSLDQVSAWRQEAVRRQRALPAALQVDTGMHRLGLSPADWQALVDQPALLHGIDLRLLISHLASAERPQSVSNRRQLRAFLQMCAAWPHVPASLANSSGIFLGRPFHFDLLRPGAALYGIAPRADLIDRVQPVVRLQAPIVQVREVAAGGRVGYNGTWRAARPSRIATVALGYADGYPRALGNRASASLAGHRVPVVGRVSMDTLNLDVTDLPPQALAQTQHCTLIDQVSTVDVLARQAGISAYTLLTGFGRRLERITVGALPYEDSAQVRRCSGAGQR